MEYHTLFKNHPFNFVDFGNHHKLLLASIDNIDSKIYLEKVPIFAIRRNFKEKILTVSEFELTKFVKCKQGSYSS